MSNIGLQVMPLGLAKLNFKDMKPGNGLTLSDAYHLLGNIDRPETEGVCLYTFIW
jgi:hypothetical protein